MATQTDRRIIQVDVTADPGAQRSIRQINTHLRSLEGSAKKAQREVENVSKKMNLLTLAAKAMIAVRIAKSITDTSDSMVLLGARLNIVAGETVGVEEAFDSLFTAANETRASITATATLYARLGFATKALELEHEDLISIVKTVNSTLLLSGANAQESASSIIQLSQAYSKGSLDGDEFRSVSEGNVVLFGLLQTELGKTARELRQMSKQGELTGDVLAKVMTSERANEITKLVGDLPMTFGQAFEQIKNAGFELAHELEGIFTFSAGLISDFIRELSAFATIGKGIATGVLSFSDLSLLTTMEGTLILVEKTRIAQQSASASRQNQIEEELIGANHLRDAYNDVLTEIISVTDRIERGGLAANNLSFPKETRTQIDKENKLLEDRFLTLIRMRGEFEKALTTLKLTTREEEELFKREEARRKIVEANAKRLEGLRKSVRTPEEKLAETLGGIGTDVAKGLDPVTAERLGTKALDEYDASLQKTKKSTKELQTESEALGVAIGVTLANGIDSIGDALFDMALGLEVSFRATIESILEDIGRLIVKITLLNALKAGLGSEAGTFGGFLFPSAKGNIFNGGDIVPFASGGVINSPTFFPLSSGIGLAGESGPEAILPLERGADGKLGVSGTGGPEQVTVNIDNNGSQSQITSSSATTDISGTVVNIVLDDLRRGGPIRDSVKGIGEF